MLIFELDQQELTEYIRSIGENSFRAQQIWQWLYVKGIKSFLDITNVPIKLRERLESDFIISRGKVSKELISLDKTRKWLLELTDKNEVEAVYIPESKRATLCVSSQVGCTLNCSFCHTGTQALVRNLTAGEIIAQVMHAKDAINDWPILKHERRLTNVVMMGMGEPLLNYNNVSKAIKIMLNSDGFDLSKRKITLSTSGIVPNIERCAKELGVNLAISLHAVKDDIRNMLVPINKKYSIAELINACKNYANITGDRRITFEYVMLKGINDSMSDARELVKLIKGIPAKINLIPFNPWPKTLYECSDHETINQFASIIESAGYKSPVRTPRGTDILAACGQLKSESKKIKAIDLLNIKKDNV